MCGVCLRARVDCIVYARVCQCRIHMGVWIVHAHVYVWYTTVLYFMPIYLINLYYILDITFIFVN